MLYSWFPNLLSSFKTDREDASPLVDVCVACLHTYFGGVPVLRLLYFSLRLSVAGACSPLSIQREDGIVIVVVMVVPDNDDIGFGDGVETAGVLVKVTVIYPHFAACLGRVHHQLAAAQ